MEIVEKVLVGKVNTQIVSKIKSCGGTSIGLSGKDQQLFKVGCDYCLDPEELISPILSQSAFNPGLGTLIEEIILEESTTQRWLQLHQQTKIVVPLTFFPPVQYQTQGFHDQQYPS